MTSEQIVEESAIGLVVGLFLLVLGSALHSPLNRVWERIKRPSPLTPQTKGQLVTSLEMAKDSLQRLNYFSTHSKDLFLYLIQLLLAAVLLSTTAFAICAFRLLVKNAPAGYVDLLLLTVEVFLALSGVLCIIGLAEAGRMSDKRIDASKNRIQKNIDEINKKLNPPV